MSELSCIIGKMSTNIGDKLGSKVADLANYPNLHDIDTFQIIISVPKSLHKNNDNIFRLIPIMFL